ncbi:hypothetical protein [Sphingomonas sp. KC8]|uniref:hypothetical protein n=1 Tax=Sphingomonas sp. KC8 TaxID=1030157 RepID=UPI0002488F71|nr:hypothetical protein [Sphingomonas sp. KC8]ARS27984.1 hypothetical protein KC8_11890 [Sphingomonas sp. KC8]
MRSPPIRFLALVAAIWVSGRIWWLMPEAVGEPAASPARASVPPRQPIPEKLSPLIAQTAPRPAATADAPPPESHAAIVLQATAARREYPSQPSTIAQPAPLPRSFDLPAPPPAPSPHRDSRWSGSAYLFVRNGSGETLATGGQLGGGQAAARIAWRLNRDGPARFALAARVSTALNDRRAAEAAAGVDIHPLPGQPLRLSVERRVDVGGHGRNAWSVYGAGGFWRDLGGNIEADGYAQAGIVGARSRDLFADGALRIVHRQPIAPTTMLRLGGGAWGGAQPGVERFDIGPRAALSLPVAQTTLTAAIEGRFRVAGDAAPGSGIALTLAADF